MTRASLAANPDAGFIGSLVGIVFGVVFVVANSGELPTAWSVGLRIAAVVVAVVLLVGAVRRRRDAGDATGMGRGAVFGRSYRVIVAVEVVALVLGLIVINGVLGVPQFAVAWIAVVVGTHFVGLGVLWSLRRHVVVGVVMTLLGLIGIVLGLGGAGIATIGVVSGVLSGVALFAVVAYTLVSPGPRT